MCNKPPSGAKRSVFDRNEQEHAHGFFVCTSKPIHLGWGYFTAKYRYPQCRLNGGCPFKTVLRRFKTNLLVKPIRPGILINGTLFFRVCLGKYKPPRTTQIQSYLRYNIQLYAAIHRSGRDTVKHARSPYFGRGNKARKCHSEQWSRPSGN